MFSFIHFLNYEFGLNVANHFEVIDIQNVK